MSSNDPGMRFDEFAPLVQRLVKMLNPKTPRGAILVGFPERSARLSAMCLEWIGPNATMRMTQVDENRVMLNVESPGLSVMPVTFTMTNDGADKIATSVAAMFDAPTE